MAIEAEERKEEIERFKEQLVKRGMKENPELDPKMLRAKIDERPLTQYLQLLDTDKERLIEGEI